MAEQTAGSTGLARLSDSGTLAPRKYMGIKTFMRHKFALGGLVAILTLVFVAIFAPLVATHDPNYVDLMASREAPSREHLLGTDDIGRDVFSRVVYGSRVSLSVGFVAVTIYVVIGTVLGSMSGYFGGFIDSLIQRITDAVMCFPSLIIIIAAVAIVGPSIWNVMVVIGLLTWPNICRLVRGQLLSLREQEFISAARASGAGNARIIFRHLLPNATAPIIVAATFGIASAILTEAGLSFLGLGVQPPTASWGNIINTAQSPAVLQQMPWVWIPAGILIAVSVLSINFVGDGLRDTLDPRSRRR